MKHLAIALTWIAAVGICVWLGMHGHPFLAGIILLLTYNVASDMSDAK